MKPLESAEEFAKRLMGLPQSYAEAWEERAATMVRARDAAVAEAMRERVKKLAHTTAFELLGMHNSQRAYSWHDVEDALTEAGKQIDALPLESPKPEAVPAEGENNER
jgi:hypothetical protein